MSFYLHTATQITQSTHKYVRNLLWTLSMKTAELIFRQLLLFIAVFVSKDHMKWCLEVVGMFNSEMAFTAFSFPQLCKTSLGNLYHEWCNENTFKMDDDLMFLLQPIYGS